MAEVIGIITGLLTAGQILGSFVRQTRQWRRLSERLFDVKQGLDCATLALESWKRKFNIAQRHRIYTEVLFGKPGSDQILATLASIEHITQRIQDDIKKLVGKPLLAGSGHGDFDVESCLRRIRKNNSWSRKFTLVALGEADELERRLERLDKKVGVLERFSDYYLEREHPGIFASIKRLAGRRVILKVGDGGPDELGKHFRNSTAARQDAQSLHRASGKGNRIHIGLSVPQIDDRDFDFLVNLEGMTQEVLVHPVKIRNVNNSSRVKKDLPTALPALKSNPDDALYVLPSAANLEGFQLSIPTTTHLIDLEHKDSLATIIRNKDTHLSSQILYPQDQSAIASGIAQGSLRLIGSPWLSFLDCTNIRWRRTQDGQWVSMLSASPGNPSTAKSIDQCLTANRARRDKRDLTKHMHIFRIGLVLAELVLKTPISYIDFDPSSHTMKLFDGDAAEMQVHDLAEAVERESNKFLGNMVFWCLNVLQDEDRMKDRMIEGSYFREVLGDAKDLDGLLREGRKRGVREE